MCISWYINPYERTDTRDFFTILLSSSFHLEGPLAVCIVCHAICLDIKHQKAD